ncbi:MAG: hypothetical protein GC179_29450 [Anaerolineaceae bacterium]|nr:hypothetical protein [Anaerolineaceae bacterium]
MLPDFLLPYSAVDTRNPIFRQLRSHLRLINSEARLRRFNRLILIGLPFMAVMWWVIERFNLNFGDVPPDFNYRLVNLILFAAVIVMFMSSFYSVPTVLGIFHKQFHSSNWEALRLTPQYNSTLLMSYDAIAQLRLWPFTALEIGLRMAVVIIFTLNSFYGLYVQSADKASFLSTIFINGFFWLALLVITLIGLAISFEPILRSRVIITLHLAVAIYIRNTPLAVLTSIAALILIHFSQTLLLTTIWAMFDDLSGGYAAGVIAVFCLIPFVLIAVIIFGAFYFWLRKFGLNLAYRTAFRQD